MSHFWDSRDRVSMVIGNDTPNVWWCSHGTFQQPCEVNWTCQFTHPTELFAGAVNVWPARSSSPLNLGSEPMWRQSPMKFLLPTLFEAAYVTSIHHEFPNTDRTFFSTSDRNGIGQGDVVSHHIDHVWKGVSETNESQVVHGKTDKNRQKSSKSIRSQFQFFRHPKPTPKWILSSLILAGTQGKKQRRKSEAPRKSLRAPGPRAENTGVKGNCSMYLFRQNGAGSVQKSSPYTVVDMDSQQWFKIWLALYIDSSRGFGHCSRG